MYGMYGVVSYELLFHLTMSALQLEDSLPYHIHLLDLLVNFIVVLSVMQEPQETRAFEPHCTGNHKSQARTLMLIFRCPSRLGLEFCTYLVQQLR